MAKQGQSWRATAATSVVLVAALAGVAAVWVLSAWWSFAEQTGTAEHLRFRHPAVLPWTLDGLACALALTAFAAALDSRPAVAARLGVFAALGGSVWSNGLGVHIRAAGLDDEKAALLVAVIVPLSAFLAFEVLLGQVRRLVFRWRGLPAPAPLPALRVTRLLLSPRVAFKEWRRAVLDVTAPLIVAGSDSSASSGLGSTEPATLDAGVAVPPVGGASLTTAPAPTPGADPGSTAAAVVSVPPAPAGPASPAPDRPDAGPDSSAGQSNEPSADSPAGRPVDGLRLVRPNGPGHRPRALPDGVRDRSAGGRSGKRPPDTVRTKPDWRRSDWSAVAQARGIKRSAAYDVIKAEGPAAVQSAREQLAREQMGESGDSA